MKRLPKISIIIPLHIETDDFRETIRECLLLDYPNFEILVGIDNNIKFKSNDPRVFIFKTGKNLTGPGEKRDMGILKAKGELIAFLDDDSYPERKWFKQSVKVINKMKVSAVCGPGLTPPADSFSRKVTGAVLASPLGSGPYYYRFIKGYPRFVDDYPAYNLIVTRSALLKIGGFGTKFYGGEDTTLCLKLINAGEKIYYHPEIVVYHHRRSFPFDYMKQVGNVGLHRGYFAKTFPQTSLRLSYFAPAIFTLGAFSIVLFSIISGKLLQLIILASIFYTIIFLYSLKDNSFLVSLFLPFAIILNYLAYGTKFVKGLFLVKLER